MRHLVVLALFLLAGACSDRSTPARPPFALTADWLNRSVTMFAQEKLADGESTAAEAMLGRLDLADWPPGPIELAITPDGATAVVTVGPGFYQSGITNVLIGSPDVPNGSAVLLIDTESLTVRAVVETRHAPLGVAITPDGKRAYTANYGMRGAAGDSVSVIDLGSGRLVDEFSVRGRPEQIAIDPDGRFAIVNLVADGGVRLFRLDDPAGSLSSVVATGNDPSGEAFLGTPTRAVVANSQSADLTLLDTSDPWAAIALQTIRIATGAPYGVTYLPRSSRLLAPTGVPAALPILRFARDELSLEKTIPLSGEPFPMIAAADETESFAFVPHMSARGSVQLSVVDLEGPSVRGLRWLEEGGPAWVATWP